MAANHSDVPFAGEASLKRQLERLVVEKDTAQRAAEQANL